MFRRKQRLHAEESPQRKIVPAKYRIEFEGDRCIWCRNCELVCSLHHEGECNPELARIHIFLDQFEVEVEGHVCRQCDDPQCLYVCPVGAIQVDEITGARIILEDRCVACGLCSEVCPYGRENIVFNPKRNVYVKCDLCSGMPQCVETCPSGALKYVQL